jgi:hypothetical protein
MLTLISRRTKLWLIWSSALTVAFGLLFVVYERGPPNTFDPFCTYRLAYRLNVTIKLGEAPHYQGNLQGDAAISPAPC